MSFKLLQVQFRKKNPLIAFLTEKMILAINFIFKFNSQNWDNILVLDKENVNETVYT